MMIRSHAASRDISERESEDTRMRWSIQMFWWCEGHLIPAVAPNDPAQVTEGIIAEWFAIRNRSAFGEEVRTSVGYNFRPQSVYSALQGYRVARDHYELW